MTVFKALLITGMFGLIVCPHHVAWAAPHIISHVAPAIISDQTPTRFVRSLFRQVAATGEEPPNAAIYTPELARLLRQDVATAAARDGVIVDWVPFCGCQDLEGIRSAVSLVSQTGDRAEVKVLLSETAGAIPTEASVPLILTLLRTKAGWRIDDAKDKSLSVHALLAKELAAK